MAARKAPKRSWLARAVRTIAIVLLALPLLYLAGVNAFLNFGGIEAMFAGTNQVSAKYRRAYTLWPGRVHVEGLRIIFQDHNLQWSLDFDRVTADLYLTALARRTFHASAVTASGGVFRMRHRIDPESKEEPWVRALPPIPEYPAPAVFEARVPEAPISDEEYNLWRVHLENVDAEIKELWVHFIRYRGGGRARGAFELVPARRLWVGPASLELSGGAVGLGDAPLLASLSGRIGCVVDSFDVRKPVGREVLRFINTDLALRGGGFQPTTLRELFDEVPPVELAVEPGTLEIQASVRRGHIRAGSEVSYTTSEVRVGERAFIAVADTVNVVARMGPDEQGELRVGAARVSVARDARATPAIVATRPSANVVTEGADTAGEMAMIGRGIELPELRIADARALNPFLGAPRRRFVQGALDGKLSLSEVGQERRAELELRARGFAAEWDGIALALSGSVAGNGATHGDAERDFYLTLKGDIERLAWSRAKHEARRRPFLVELRRATLELDAGRRPEGRSRGKLRVNAASLLARTPTGDDESVVRLKRPVISLIAKDVSRSRLDGILELSAEQGEIQSGERAIRLRPELSAELGLTDVETLAGRMRGSFTLKDVVATHGDATGHCSTFRAPELRLTLDGTGDGERVHARAVADFAQARFDWGDFEASATARVTATLSDFSPDSGVGRVALLADVTEPTLKSGVSDAAGWVARAPKVAANLQAWTGPVWLGSLTVDAPGVSGRVGKTRVRGDFSGKLPVFSADLARRLARFSGQVSLVRAEVAAETPVRDWWARIDVRSALVAAEQNLDLSALFSARLRDLTPGVAILDADGSLPGWLGGLVPSSELHAEGMVKRRCRLTEIQVTRAVDGPVTLRGRMQSVSEDVRGAFLVRLSAFEALSAGVAFGAADTDVSVLAGDGWLREQGVALDASAENAFRGECAAPDQSCGVN